MAFALQVEVAGRHIAIPSIRSVNRHQQAGLGTDEVVGKNAGKTKTSVAVVDNELLALFFLMCRRRPSLCWLRFDRDRAIEHRLAIREMNVPRRTSF